MIWNDVVLPVINHSISFEATIISMILRILDIHPGILTVVTHLVLAALLCKRLTRAFVLCAFVLSRF